jgi:transcriptional regulator with XRE-family HTH domain
VPAGKELKTLRNRRNITVREVEQASRRIADVKGDKRFCISNGWLAQLENGVSEPSICKLFSLSVIYRANFLDLVRLYNVDIDDREKHEPVANPLLAQLEPHNGNGHSRSRTSHIIYGHLGLSDYTMYPMIQPNALLKIDTSQDKLTSIAWRNEYERPIYFIELRGGYACGWCELHGNQLLIIPHPSSPAGVRQFTYLKEAEIVGRVIGYSTATS